MFKPASYFSCAGITAKEDPIAAEMRIHDIMSFAGIQRPSHAYQLIFYQGIHRIEDQRAYRFRTSSGLMLAHEARLFIRYLMPPRLPALQLRALRPAGGFFCDLRQNR